MTTKVNISSKELIRHHAYLVVSEPQEAKEKLFELVEKAFGVKTHGNPDFWSGEFDVFGIDDGRTLQGAQLRKSVTGGRKIFVVFFNFITREAQNSLLKVFEEPTEGTHFIVVTPSAETLLPTLRSRFTPLEDAFPGFGGAESGVSETEKKAREFLKLNAAERLSSVSDMIETKDKAGAVSFLNHLEALFYEKVKMDRATEEEVAFLEQISETRKYVRDRAPSLKILLENIALSVPQ